MIGTPLRVLVVGAGGTGSWLVDGMAKLLEFSRPDSVLLLVDGDNYEEKNLSRQSFVNMGNKAESKAEQLMPQYPRTFIVAEPKWVVADGTDPVDDADQENPTQHIEVSKLLREGDIVFTTVDNHAARKLVFDAARNLDNISVFTGGNDDALFGSVYHYQRRDGKDVTDHPAIYHEEFVNPPDKNPGEMSCQQRAELEGGGQIIAANMAVASVLLARFQKVILDDREDTECEIFFDLDKGSSASSDWRTCLDSEPATV